MAEAYRSSFATLCAGTIDQLLDDTHGSQHLDVGSGTGELARRAQALGRAVMAVDSDAEMVAMTAHQHTGATLLASLPDLPVRRRFDAVTANFVVNHTADPRAGVREHARTVRPAVAWP